MPSHFTPALFGFLRDIRKNNTREWFLENRDRYVKDVETPTLAFITDIGPRLRSVSRAVVADPRRTGGSMYRIYRDVRFSSDKSPYKSHVAATFAHEQRKAAPSVPGFYLHLEPGDSMGGGGIYHPDPSSLTRIRLAIVEDSAAWQRVRETGIELEGESLTRAPAGFDPKHRFIEDIRRKDFYALTPFTQREVCASDFVDRYVESCHRIAPLLAFQARALGLRW